MCRTTPLESRFSPAQLLMSQNLRTTIRAAVEYLTPATIDRDSPTAGWCSQRPPNAQLQCPPCRSTGPTTATKHPSVSTWSERGGDHSRAHYHRSFIHCTNSQWWISPKPASHSPAAITTRAGGTSGSNNHWPSGSNSHWPSGSTDHRFSPTSSSKHFFAASCYSTSITKSGSARAWGRSFRCPCHWQHWLVQIYRDAPWILYP